MSSESFIFSLHPIVRSSLANRRLTASDLRHSWNESCQIDVSTSTVKRRLSDVGLRGCVAVKTPLISATNRRSRLEFAARHKHWKVEDWENVLWSDESSFDIFNSAKRVFVRRRPNEKLRNDCVLPTVKFGGGKVMVWGCMSSHGVAILKRVDGHLNANGYMTILQDCMLPSAGATFGSGEWIFSRTTHPATRPVASSGGLRKIQWTS